MPPDQRLRGLVHRRGVEGGLHPPGAAALERERRAAVDDAIEIMARAGAAPGVETGLRRFRFDDRDRVRLKQRVEPLAEPERLPVALEVDMRDLAQRMDARVGAPRAVGDRALSRHGEQGVLQRLLNRKPVLLPLPADERRAVVFDGELIARHSGCLRAVAPLGKARAALRVEAPRREKIQNRLSWAPASLAFGDGFTEEVGAQSPRRLAVAEAARGHFEAAPDHP